MKSVDAGSHAFFEAQQKVYPRSINGFFMRWRWALVFTQFVFYVVPWIQWGDRQMVLFDIGARRFYFIWDGFIPAGCDLSCGTADYLCACPFFICSSGGATVVWGLAVRKRYIPEIFMWIEQKVEGDRSARIRLDNSNWTFRKFEKIFVSNSYGSQQFLYGQGFFCRLLVPIRDLGYGDYSIYKVIGRFFWVLFYGFATYGNAGYLREQVCKYMCPYARFQSAMLDRDSLIVSYGSCPW